MATVETLNEQSIAKERPSANRATPVPTQTNQAQGFPWLSLKPYQRLIACNVESNLWSLTWTLYICGKASSPDLVGKTKVEGLPVSNLPAAATSVPPESKNWVHRTNPPKPSQQKMSVQPNLALAVSVGSWRAWTTSWRALRRILPLLGAPGCNAGKLAGDTARHTLCSSQIACPSI